MTASTFAKNLASLPEANDLARLELLGQDGLVATTIENKPGSQGSLRIYRHLAQQWGGITPSAAAHGLLLYAEHTEDARRNPGKHPNIDRLLDIASNGTTYTVRCVPAQA